MKTGELRSSVMDNCPEDFEQELKNFIDNIEGLVNDVLSLMEIDHIDDIGRLEDAHDELKDLSKGLY